MTTPIKVSRKQVAAIIEATFPEYKGRKIVIKPALFVYLAGLNWSGGSRSQYRACTLDGTRTGGADGYNQRHPLNNRQVEGAQLPIPPGHVVVEHTLFCGKDIGIRIHTNPVDLPQLLTHGA
jgi:hypothetical protein